MVKILFILILRGILIIEYIGAFWGKNYGITHVN